MLIVVIVWKRTTALNSLKLEGRGNVAVRRELRSSRHHGLEVRAAGHNNEMAQQLGYRPHEALQSPSAD